jgi:hypothetical protein
VQNVFGETGARERKMKRFLWLLLMMLTLAACIRRTPTPTDSPIPTVLPNPTPLPSSTPTPPGSPVPRITIVPSATRIERPVQVESTIPTASPTSTIEVLPTLTPSDTPTPQVVDAGPTATPQPSPTATPLQSPLPTPSPNESPLEPPSTVTPNSSAAGEAWGFEKVFAYFDANTREFYIAGEVINNNDDHQRITMLTPVVLDENGSPVTSAEDVVPSVEDYDQLLESISLAPDKGLPFAFKVSLPEEASFEEDPDFLIESEPAEPARDDLDIPFDDFDRSDWPGFFLVQGSYNNPGSSLQDYVAVVVTVYDDDERVIGLGWWDHNENPALLEPGEHDFLVEAEMWEIAETLALEVYDYDVQVFGH